MLLKNFYFSTAIVLIVSYLIGSFPSAYIAGRIKKIDLYKTGSRNIGGMNTFTSVGKLAGVLVTIVDFGKGALAAYLATKFSGNHPFISLLAVVAAVIGHNWMIYIGFKGGKGISTFLGGLLFFSPLSFLFLYLLFVPVALFLLKDSYVATSVSYFFFLFFLWYREDSCYYAIFVILVTIVYSIKSYSLLRSYFTRGRRDVNPVIKRIFKPFFRGM